MLSDRILKNTGSRQRPRGWVISGGLIGDRTLPFRVSMALPLLGAILALRMHPDDKLVV